MSAERVPDVEASDALSASPAVVRAFPEPLPIRHVAVVVPARDEEALLARCLDALVAAQEPPGVSVELLLVLDRCRDGSAAVASRYPRVRVLALDADARGDVGRARAEGVAAALRRSPAPPSATWLACTDADSVVPATWLRTHARLADDGADLVIGTVRPDPADLTSEQLAAWAATRVAGRPNGHVHGANLGVRASVYLAAGGFGPASEHEDVELVARARRLGGVREVPSDEVDVLTSGRRVGRTPGGYAGYLRERFGA